ncbi:MAG: hypothetical protein JNM85_08405 [Chthonomonas sp.]|nr:hypothetical protein [Chthonomonas sp.]
MKTRTLALLLALTVTIPVGFADGGVNYSTGSSTQGMSAAKRKARAIKTSTIESALVGIGIYDSGAKVIAKYGSPDEIMAITLGGGGDSGGGDGGGGGRAGGPSSGGRSGEGGGAGPGGGPRAREDARPEGMIGDPFGAESFNQFSPEDEGGGRNGGMNEGANPRGNAGGSGGGGASGDGTSTTVEATQFVRWVYRFQGSRYGFVLDKFNKVIQIEAIGIKDARVLTRRGIEFGDSFADVMKRYATPDGYEISGDTMVVRFLTNSRVAFRFQKISQGKKHQVTGIVVAAGKK